jgi:hypothetical protein
MPQPGADDAARTPPSRPSRSPSGGHRAPPTWGRPLAEWQSLLQAIGFAVQARPMSQGTPFANVLLIADRA